MRLLRPETRVSDLGCHVGIMWMFPKIVVPPNSNHPLKNRGFPLFSPSILGVFPLIFGETPMLKKNMDFNSPWPPWPQNGKICLLELADVESRPCLGKPCLKLEVELDSRLF